MIFTIHLIILNVNSIRVVLVHFNFQVILSFYNFKNKNNSITSDSANKVTLKTLLKNTIYSFYLEKTIQNFHKIKTKTISYDTTTIGKNFLKVKFLNFSTKTIFKYNFDTGCCNSNNCFNNYFNWNCRVYFSTKKANICASSINRNLCN
jgi:hypothetical protein